MNKCKFTSRCKSEATHRVIHKAVGARAEYSVEACQGCASKIGSGTREGALINQPGMESAFYKIERM